MSFLRALDCLTCKWLGGKFRILQRKGLTWQKQMTINEIAKLANTSRGTVDRVINKRGDVNQEVEKRVIQIINETGYLSSKDKKLFSLSNSKIEIGVIIASLNNIFFDQILMGMKKALANQYRYSGLDLQIHKVRLFNDQEVIDAINSLSKKTRLLIVSASGNETIERKIDSLNIPVITVSIDMDCHNKIGFVGCDFYNSGALAADVVNLLQNTNSKAAVMIGSYSHQGHRQRLEGFKAKVDPNITILDPIQTFDDDEIGYQRTQAVLAKEHPDIIVFFGAGMAGGLKAIKEYQGKVRVVTVDEIPEVVEGLHSGLVSASVSQFPLTQGKKCIEIAYDYLVKGQKQLRVIKVANAVLLKDSVLPY